MSTQAQDLTIRKSVTVDCSPEHAFDTFTVRLGNWWPLDTHSVGGMAGRPPRHAVLEPGVGGRLYEQMPDGDEHEWAKVLAWEPPNRFVTDWHVNPDNPPTEVEVTFTPQGDGTRVELVHRGWERYGDRGSEASGDYGSGWEKILGRFAEAASG